MVKWSAKKALQRRALLWIVPPLGYLVIRLLYLSCKKRWHLPQEPVPHEPYLVAFWHGEILMDPFIFLKSSPGRKMALMISEHFDGELIARTAGFFGFAFVRGSSRKGAIKALRESFRKIAQGYSIAISPDGPKGPRYSVADGIVAIAQKRRMKIVTYRYTASRYWQLNSWDRFMIPKPFATLDFYMSAPFDVVGLSKEEAKAKIKEKLGEEL